MTQDQLERFTLAQDKIRQIREATDNVDGEKMPEAALDYFFETSNLCIGTFPILKRSEKGETGKASFADFVEEQEKLYGLFKGERYENSFLNPSYAVERLGQKTGGILSAIYMDLTALIPWSYEGEGAKEKILIFLELLIELHTIFAENYEAEESEQLSLEELYSSIHASLMSFEHDYTELFVSEGVKALILPEESKFYTDILMNSDLDDPRYLYFYGSAVGTNELGLWEYISRLSEKEVRSLARTYVDGYINGFAVSGRDVSIKETVSIEYPIGLERVMRMAVKMFETEGLHVTIRRDSVLSSGRRGAKRGLYTDAIDPQVYYDHRDDRAYYFDRAFVNRTTEVMKTTYERYKKEARLYGGPAVVETFGEKKFDPVNKPESITYSEEQNGLITELMAQSGKITNDYIHGDERSFTVISYPYPSIGDKFGEIFSRTVEVNTLDAKKWQKIQQALVDSLDQGDRVEIKGRNGNRTDLVVALHPLSDPSKQSNFENCLADVNIPVGEVFTSPQLEGTNGTLHVSRVYLNGFEYRDLELSFKEGMIDSISCKNFETREENDRYIDDHILFHHKTLPIGEFAIGTNTTAYKMAKEFDIEDRMPILIAEKTGPHFAVGDTCYSESEDVATYNPDGKELIARDNSITEKYRKTEPMKAYFNCHTDITIPYDELGSITVLRPDGRKEVLIDGGRFVLPGTEELNIPLDEI